MFTVFGQLEKYYIQFPMCVIFKPETLVIP